MPGNNFNKIDDILAVSNLLNLSEYVVEKDIYVTKAIALLSQVEDEYFQLVFQGGTCLSKAHRIVQRMSEDCDFRIKLLYQDPPQSKGIQRKNLRLFRKKIIAALTDNDFIIEPDEIRVRNEGQFMSLRARYAAEFVAVGGIKPYLALEFFLGEVKTETEEKPISTLIKYTLGDKVDHPSVLVQCLSVTETAAEKWVALTRRVATATHRSHYRDASLVRHLYDLYHIQQHGFEAETFRNLAVRIVDGDREQFKHHNERYYQAPGDEIKRALDMLRNAPQWREYWQQFLETMVFDKDVLSYDDVLKTIYTQSEIVLASLSDHNSNIPA